MKSLKEGSIFKIAVILIMVLEAAVLSGVIFYLASNRTFEASIPVSGIPADGNYAYKEKYVLYIGLNDKDTYTQIISVEEAKKIINDICIKYADGYTVTEANGGWIDETGALTEEISLVYTLSNVEETDVVSIMDEVLAALNQNSILVERQRTDSMYYSGK